MRILILIIGMVVPLFLTGCVTPVQAVDQNVKPIILKEAETRAFAYIAGDNISVPAGVYEPDFEANNGIYYRAPTHLVGHGLGLSFVLRGGIFVQNPLPEKEKPKIQTSIQVVMGRTVKDVRPIEDPTMGVWYDQQESSGGILVWAASSPTIIHWVAKPFDFNLQNP